MKTNRNLYRVIYTSSYDRGLQHLLEIWPDVKKEVPESELHVFYGWQLFDRFYHDNPASMKWKDHIEEMMKADGITHHGRVSQPQIAEEMKQSGIWAYPTHFGEINCITALKAQAYGAVPVVIDYAALETTVQFGIKVKGDIYEPAVENSFKKELIWALQTPDWLEKVRVPMMAWASQHFTWKNIAKQWDQTFKGDSAAPFWQIPADSIIKVVNGEEAKNG